jgi:hypothetical protein
MYKPSSSDIIDFKDLEVEGVKELKSLGDVQSSLQRLVLRSYPGREETNLLYRYARSKLANILFTRSLASHLRESGYPNIFVNCLNPGIISFQPRSFLSSPSRMIQINLTLL